MNIPRINDKPINRSPNINNQSIIGFPARLLNIMLKGPLEAKLINPWAGDTPNNQAFLDSVANPRPNNLSKKAHNKISPSEILVISKRYCSFFILSLFLFSFYKAFNESLFLNVCLDIYFKFNRVL